MAITLEYINSTPRSDTLNAVQFETFATAPTIGAAASNATTQAVVLCPYQYKIRKIAVYFSAIDNITTDSFNLVVGPGAYTQGNIAANDNSFDPGPTVTVGFDNTLNSGAVLGGLGYPTNVATIGQAVFAADVLFNVANFPNIATGTGGYGILIPTNYDAVYPAGVPLTLRTTTTVGTGSISNLTVCVGVVPMRLRPAPVGSQLYAALPGKDY